MLGAAAALLALAALPALADKRKSAEFGIEFDVPETWQVTDYSDNIVLGPNAAASFAILITTVTAANWDAAPAGFGDEVKKVIAWSSFEAHPESLADMRCLTARGEGKAGDKDQSYRAVLLDARRPTLIVATGTPKNWDANQKAIDAFFASVKRAN
jgi:hypothetical protein